jgi:fucose permease
MTTVDKADNRPIKIVLHAVFLLSGVTTIIIGQVLPIISNRFSLNDLEAGYFFPAQFSGSVLGTFLTNWFGRNHKYLAATIFGCLSMAAGTLLMNAGSLYVSLLGFFVNGVGVGLTLPSINMLILEMSPLRPASALNVLNFCWGLGAILCKPFIDTFSNGTSILTATLLLAVPLVIAAGLTVVYGKGIEHPPAAEIDAAEPAKTDIWTTTLAWTLALFNFIHVGFESGVGGWLTTYSERIDYAASIRVLSPTFIFYVFFVVGRGVAPLYFRFLNENRSMLISLIVILAGMGITLTADSALILSVGAALSGLGTSSVFPTSLARFGRVFGSEAARRAMPLFISGTVGSIVITWLIGFFSNRVGDLRSGMYVLVVSIVLLIALQIGIGLRTTISPEP